MLTGKERCLRAIKGEPIDRVPVFPLLMSLSADRAGLTYREFASNGVAFAEAQLGMMERFGLDAITACSDPSRVPADFGGEIVFPDKTPPFLVNPLVRSPQDVERLGSLDPTRGRMGDRVLAVRTMVRHAGERAMIVGWVDGAFAEACTVCGLSHFMMMLMDDPATAHRLLEKLTEIEIGFAVAQVEAGAVMIGLGDAAASLISAEMYREFVLPYEQRIIRAVHERGGLVKLHICGNTTALVHDVISCEADLFNIDHTVDFGFAAQVYGEAGVAFKGNVDPVGEMLQSTPEACRAVCREKIEIARGLRYMLGAGCEIPAATSDAVMDAFCLAWKD